MKKGTFNMLKRSTVINNFILPISLSIYTLLYVNYLDTLSWQISLLLIAFFILANFFETYISTQVRANTFYLPEKNILMNTIFIAFSVYIAYLSSWFILIPTIFYLLIIQLQFVFFHYQLEKIGHIVIAFLKSYLPILSIFYAHLNFVPMTLIRITLLFLIPQYINIWLTYQYVHKNNDHKDDYYNPSKIKKYIYPLTILSPIMAVLLTFPSLSYYSFFHLLLIPLYVYQHKHMVTEQKQFYTYFISYPLLILLVWGLFLH